MFNREKIREMLPWLGLGYLGIGIVVYFVFLINADPMPKIPISFLVFIVIAIAAVIFKIRNQISRTPITRKIRFQGILIGSSLAIGRIFKKRN